MKRWVFVALTLFACGAIDCSQACRVRTVIELPAGVAPVVAKLNLTLATGTKPLPAPGPVVGVSDNPEIESRRNGFVSTFTIHGSYHWVQLTAWIDENGSGALDSGDLVGSLPGAIEARDRGLCVGNLTDTPPIVLRVMP